MREAQRREGRWELLHELLATILEEVSILAADRRRKKPLEVPRPGWFRAKATGRNPGVARAGGAYSDAIDRMLAAGPPRR